MIIYQAAVRLAFALLLLFAIATLTAVAAARQTSQHGQQSGVPPREITNVRSAKANPATIEGEIGDIGSGSEIHDAAPDLKKGPTKPAEAKQFVEATRVDTLAPAVGNMHGMLKSMVTTNQETAGYRTNPRNQRGNSNLHDTAWRVRNRRRRFSEGHCGGNYGGTHQYGSAACLAARI